MSACCQWRGQRSAFSKKCLAAFMGGMIYIKSDYSQTPNHLRVHIKNTSRAAAQSHSQSATVVLCETREQINKLCTQHTHLAWVWKKRAAAPRLTRTSHQTNKRRGKAPAKWKTWSHREQAKKKSRNISVQAKPVSTLQPTCTDFVFLQMRAG